MNIKIKMIKITYLVYNSNLHKRREYIFVTFLRFGLKYIYYLVGKTIAMTYCN